jgi:hypothetical protein
MIMDIKVRPMIERDLAEADRIIRLAFGTFLGLADPMTVWGDADFAYTRFAAAPEAALAAEVDGKLVGSNFATGWGSVGFFGPLSVEPRLWEQKIAKYLLEPTMDLFAKWGCRHTGLFTFSQARGALSEIWILAALSHSRDVQTGCFSRLSGGVHQLFPTSAGPKN